ncbi:MAG: 3-phosphoshikimate 1-carboxyvinyltransferase [Bacteroidota bacterium]
MNLQLVKTSAKAFGKVNISGSKSISNRIIIIRELSGSICSVNNLSLSDDTQRLLFYINMIATCGKSGIPMVIDANNAGTVSRFLSAFLIYREGTWLVTGNERMKVRPIEGLVDGLQMLNAQITYPDKKGYLPIRIIGSDIIGGHIEVDVTKSSQFISAIMMIGPYLYEGLKISFKGKPVSIPYIEMTQKLMQKFGAYVELNDEGVHILHGKYKFHPCSVESDWSSASYWYETVALADNAEIQIPGLAKNSLQGDSVLVNIYEQLGVTTRFEGDGITLIKTKNITDKFSYDFEGCPDIVPAVMATCAALGIKSVFKNIGHLAFKESNRIKALALELKKVGASLKKNKNSYTLTTGTFEPDNSLVFRTHGDHRIAMCLAPLVLKYNNIEICSPNVVNKSYPEFWDELKKLNFATLKKSYEPIGS